MPTIHTCRSVATPSERHLVFFGSTNALKWICDETQPRTSGENWLSALAEMEPSGGVGVVVDCNSGVGVVVDCNSDVEIVVDCSSDV